MINSCFLSLFSLFSLFVFTPTDTTPCKRQKTSSDEQDNLQAMLPITVFLHDSLTRLQQSNMNRLLRPHLDSAKAFTIRHWPKMMLVAINLPMIPFWYYLLSTGPEFWIAFQEMKVSVSASADDDPLFQNLMSIFKFIEVLASVLILLGTDSILDLYVLLSDSVRAAKLRRALFWAFQSMYMTGEVVAWMGGLSIVDLSWWFIRLSNLDRLDGKSPEEVALARKDFEINFANQLAEDAKTMVATTAAMSWGGIARQWAWDIWTNTWVQGAIIGWVLHVLIMDLQGEPRAWWGGRLQREKRDEETAQYKPDEKKPSDHKTD
ncbi:hypothetical protein K457DRAFT_159914 [Linnemannia elongata AG-77]|uniref:Uncharacterized protein n=1 Tax=Linnemannia elongata AG-77 TaxID=1314771 RepID=A0A197JD36_9FUNG|nr:hypothetical protein K457DRAFT_159914 [Linnemannia elongata AG-77]